MMNIAPSAAPTPIPALAPVLSDEEDPGDVGAALLSVAGGGGAEVVEFAGVLRSGLASVLFGDTSCARTCSTPLLVM